MKAILERRRGIWPDSEEVWHAIPRGAEYDADWCPILCSEDEGIVCHGGARQHEVTCPDCIALLAQVKR